MDFKTATDRLGIPLPEVAAELERDLGSAVSVQWLRQARLDPSSDGHRTPPPGWETTVRRLARERGGDLVKLADELEAEG